MVKINREVTLRLCGVVLALLFAIVEYRLYVTLDQKTEALVLLGLFIGTGISIIANELVKISYG